MMFVFAMSTYTRALILYYKDLKKCFNKNSRREIPKLKKYFKCTALVSTSFKAVVSATCFAPF